MVDGKTGKPLRRKTKGECEKLTEFAEEGNDPDPKQRENGGSGEYEVRNLWELQKMATTLTPKLGAKRGIVTTRAHLQ